MNLTVRELVISDFDAAMALYRELVGKTPLPDTKDARERYKEILSLPGTSIIGAELDRQIRSMATLHILPNITFSGRPYALIENVVTFAEFRGRGLSSKVMSHAIELAWRSEVYKIMLLTGRDFGARGFYEKLGFTADEKHGMTLRRAPKRQPIS